jgi:protein gp37
MIPMGAVTTISWSDSTFNPWIGCTHVSPACDHCYAEADFDRRKHRVSWGAGNPRSRTSVGYWREPHKWNRDAIKTGYRPRIFCASLADVFDNEVDPQWRSDLWAVIRDTPMLHWMLLTKRIGNARKMLPADWDSGRYAHVGLMATIADQEEWDRDYRKLTATPAAWHGVSIEPMLGAVDIGDARPDWIIARGESGPQARDIDGEWVRSLRDQCRRNGIAFHFKQWGGLRAKSNGCALDGVEHKAFPAALARQAL